MLNSYLASTAQLLQNPPAPNALYSQSLLTSYINSARGQLAGESKCLRFMGTLPLVAGQQSYPFSQISLTGSVGIQGILDLEIIWVQVASGQKWLRPRPWPWFSQYELNNPVPATGPPKVWSQYGQGAQGTGSTVGGTLYVSPVPDASYTVNVDATCYPIALVDDTTVEALPYMWTDAVPYFAAYQALLSSQTSARADGAVKMFELYKLFVKRAREASTPAVLPSIYPPADPVSGNQLQPQQGGQQQ